jgi:hypothetical protein
MSEPEIMITRRSLFGLGIGAAAIPVVGVATTAPDFVASTCKAFMVGLDFGTRPIIDMGGGYIETDKLDERLK